MKRVMMCVLASVLGLSLVACGQKEDKKVEDVMTVPATEEATASEADKAPAATVVEDKAAEPATETTEPATEETH